MGLLEGELRPSLVEGADPRPGSSGPEASWAPALPRPARGFRRELWSRAARRQETGAFNYPHLPGGAQTLPRPAAGQEAIDLQVNRLWLLVAGVRTQVGGSARKTGPHSRCPPRSRVTGPAAWCQEAGHAGGGAPGAQALANGSTLDSRRGSSVVSDTQRRRTHAAASTASHRIPKETKGSRSRGRTGGTDGRMAGALAAPARPAEGSSHQRAFSFS